MKFGWSGTSFFLVTLEMPNTFFCHRGSSEYQATRIFRIAHDHKHCLQWIKSTFYAFHASIKTFYVDTKHITTGFFRIIERQIHPKSLLSTNSLYELMFSLATSKIQFSVFFYTPVNFWHSWRERREGNYTKR